MEEEEGLPIGSPAPDLAIDTLNGKGKLTADSLSSRIVVVSFWSSSCKPCEDSFPKLEELSKKYGSKVEVIGMSGDDERAHVNEWAAKHGASFSIGWDQNHTIAKSWKVSKMPTTIVLDGKFRVRNIHSGFHESDINDLNEELASLTNDGKDTAVAQTGGSEIVPPFTGAAPKKTPASTKKTAAKGAKKKAAKAPES